MGGAPQPNAKGKYTRSGSVLGRSTQDVNDYYAFHEVRFTPNRPAPLRFAPFAAGRTRFFVSRASLRAKS